MLQQTQVERVVPKWYAWLEQFPTLEALARASRADAIRAWQGLGYNLRAVRLHSIATQVMVEFEGALPNTLEGLLALKGIGRYTAGAVACFAYGLPVSIVDTNVRRVLGRVFRDADGTLDDVADAVLAPGEAYAWNQALMDLGATLCRSEAPLCLVCPVRDLCASAGQVVARTRAKQSRFAGSARYFRGRVLDALRTLPDGAAISVDELAMRIEPHCTDERLRELVEGMIADGLVQRDGDARLKLA
jgi:A/G-specific adenine glycosylase